MKKLILVVVLVVLLMGFTGCFGEQASNPSKQQKVVKIDSDPEGATAVIDNKLTVTTPSQVELTLGYHSVIFSKHGYQGQILKQVEVSKDTTEIKVKLEKITDETIITLTKESLDKTLLNLPSKLAFVSNGVLYLSDEQGKVVEKVATANSNCEAKILGVSPSLKWIILKINPKDTIIISKQFLYAVNIETPEIIKIAEDNWEGTFDVSFELASDKLIYGFRGVNAPFSSVAMFNLDTKKFSYLLDPSKNSEEKAFRFDLSDDGKYIAYVGGDVEAFPNNGAALYLKNLETGSLKMLVKPSNLNPNTGQDFISDVNFIDGKKILYSREIAENGSNYNHIIKYYVVDFEGHTKEITESDALKLFAINQPIEDKLKSLLNKNLHVNALLKNCNKIVFTILTDPEKLFLCDTNFSHIQDMQIVNPNVMNFSYGCKFVCGTLTLAQTTETHKLICAETNAKIDLTEPLKMDVTSAIYIAK